MDIIKDGVNDPKCWLRKWQIETWIVPAPMSNNSSFSPHFSAFTLVDSWKKQITESSNIAKMQDAIFSSQMSTYISS